MWPGLARSFAGVGDLRGLAASPQPSTHVATGNRVSSSNRSAVIAWSQIAAGALAPGRPSSAPARGRTRGRCGWRAARWRGGCQRQGPSINCHDRRSGAEGRGTGVPSKGTYTQVRTRRCDTHHMTRKKLPADITDVQEIVRSIRDKWALLILHELSSGTKRPGELRRGIRGISHKMLTEPLRNLERDRSVRRTVYPVVSPRVDYALTPLGGTLTTPLHALYRWTERHAQEIQRARRATKPPGPAVKPSPSPP
jgi:DNA-binding HxlR family transcriptional regulator